MPLVYLMAMHILTITYNSYGKVLKRLVHVHTQNSVNLSEFFCVHIYPKNQRDGNRTIHILNEELRIRFRCTVFFATFDENFRF